MWIVYAVCRLHRQLRSHCVDGGWRGVSLTSLPPIRRLPIVCGWANYTVRCSKRLNDSSRTKTPGPRTVVLIHPKLEGAALSPDSRTEEEPCRWTCRGPTAFRRMPAIMTRAKKSGRAIKLAEVLSSCHRLTPFQQVWISISEMCEKEGVSAIRNLSGYLQTSQ